MQHSSGAKVSEKGVLGRVFGPRSEEVTPDWMRLCNEEHHDLYLAVNIIGSSYIQWAMGRLIQGLISS
jgi:hypothetical protein